jgi:very-short-patch-repair endonuclease
MTINDKVSMFYNAKPDLFEKAKVLRNNMTKSELVLWEMLRKHRLHGFRFKPQHPIDIFKADFYCNKLNLVVEVDGGIHKTVEQRDYDIGRENELGNLGIKVIRFTNQEIEENIGQVIKKIESICISLEIELANNKS